MAEYKYNERFRMNSVKLEYIISRIGHLLVHHTNRNHALSTIQQIHLYLHFLGSGTQYSITLLVTCTVYQKLLFVV